MMKRDSKSAAKRNEDVLRRTVSDERCEYCHKRLSTKYALKRHEDVCEMRYDEIRRMEIAMDREGVEEVEGACRYCLKPIKHRRNEKRHWKNCENRRCYREELEEDSRKKNWYNFGRIPENEMRMIVRTGNAVVCVERVMRRMIRDSRILVSNLRSNVAKVMEGGMEMTKNLEEVLYEVTNSAVNMIQDASDEGMAVKSIDGVNRIEEMNGRNRRGVTREEREIMKEVMLAARLSLYDNRYQRWYP